MVLMAAMPAAPPLMAARAGSRMSPMFGVIFAHTGIPFAASTTQPVTSSTMDGSCPIAAPMLRSGWPCGHEKLHSKPSTPHSAMRRVSSCQRALSYCSMMEAMSIRSGYSSFRRLKSSSQSSSGRSEMSSMLVNPMVSPRPSVLAVAKRCCPYLGATCRQRDPNGWWSTVRKGTRSIHAYVCLGA